MSLELEEAKRKVAEFQKQCEEYLVIIVQQKCEADEQQKVSSRGPCQCAQPPPPSVALQAQRGASGEALGAGWPA